MNTDAQDFFSKHVTKYDKISWWEIYPTLPNEVIDLLEGMLKFNPHEWFTAEEALKSPLFDPIWVLDWEDDSKRLFDNSMLIKH